MLVHRFDVDYKFGTTSADVVGTPGRNLVATRKIVFGILALKGCNLILVDDLVLRWLPV